MRRSTTYGMLLLTLNCLLILSGCNALNRISERGLRSFQTRTSFVAWNTRCLLGKSPPANASRGLELASRSSKELQRMLEVYPAPNSDTLAGRWYGINKGYGPALAGVTQDIKVFTVHASDCGKLHICGHNVLIEQVPLCDLNQLGWQAKRDRCSGAEKTIGNFIGLQPRCPASNGDQVLDHALILDYKNDSNARFDPTRYLFDELVQIDENLLLGKAALKFGAIKVHAAYFVLYRCDCSCDEYDQSIVCDTLSCD